MTEEQAAALADPTVPSPCSAASRSPTRSFADLGHVLERFRSGDGMGWGEHHHDLFEGTERLFAPGYRRDLVPSWLPALDGVVGSSRRARASPTSAAGTGSRRS